ncbi:MAG: lactonase family protein [Chloroflexi bacterium]|nr:lactonase family protein [Chloroflexota bacterium]
MTENLVYIANAGDADYGITVAALDYDKGALEVVQQVTEISECHYLNLHPSGKFLLATTMDGAVEVVAFAIDAAGMLRKVSSAPAAGTSPAYVCADASGRCALLVNYVNAGARGNIRVYPIDEAGNLGEVSEHIEIDDSTGPNQERQDVSHPHMIVTTPDNRFAVVPDLGTDKIYLYALDAAPGKLTPAGSLDLPAGAGPRHVAFHPTLPRMYGINELDSTVAAWSYDEQNNFTRLAIESTLPADYQQPAERQNTTADVHVHPNGRFLYGSNRGHDSIVIYRLDADGLPSYITTESTRGAWPRAFMIDPRGEYLVVGNRHSDNAAVFSIDAASGLLTFRSSLALSAPIAFKMNS